MSLSNDATYLSQGRDNTLEVRTYQIAPRANSWAISPDGRWAIAWTDVTRVTRPDVIEGFQQISIIDLEDTTAPSRVPVRTVGFRPSSITFAANPPRAFAVTEDGITVVDLSMPRDPRVLRTLKLDATGPLALHAAAELTQDDASTPDGGAPDGDDDAGGASDAAIDAGGATDAAIDVVDDGAAGDSSDPGDAGPTADVVSDVISVDVPVFDAARDAGPRLRRTRRRRGRRSDDRRPHRPTPARDTGPIPPQTGKADVSITPDGAFAIFRREGSAIVTVIDLADGSRWSWTLSGPVTDLDLADTGNRAVAVIRDQGRIAVLPVPGRGATSFDDILVAGETVGSVAIAPHGEQALLYTNAVALNRITVLALAAAPAYRAVPLHAPVLSVFPSPTAEHAIVVHNSFKGQAFQSPGAFSVMPLCGRPNTRHPADRRSRSVGRAFPRAATAPSSPFVTTSRRSTASTWRGCRRWSSIATRSRARPPRPASSDRRGTPSSPRSIPVAASASSTPPPSRYAPSPASSWERASSSGRRKTEVNDEPEHPSVCARRRRLSGCVRRTRRGMGRCAASAVLGPAP